MRKEQEDGYLGLVYLKDVSCSSYSLILHDVAGESLQHDKNVSCLCLNFVRENQGTKRSMVDDSVLFQREADPHPDSRATALEYLGVQSFLIKENPMMTFLLNLMPDRF